MVIENPMDQILGEYLSDQEKKALEVIYKAFGVKSLDDLSEKYGTSLQSAFTNLSTPSEIISGLKDKYIVQLMGQMKPDENVFRSNVHLPVRETFAKIMRLLIIRLSYENFGKETTRSLLETSLKELLKALAIEGDTIRRPIEIMKQLENDLNEIDILSRLYDWPYTLSQLDAMAEFLYKNGYVESREEIKKCFKIQHPNVNERILWKKDTSDLVYLAFKLWTPKFIQEFHLIAMRRFKIQKGPIDPDLFRRLLQWHKV